MFYFNMFALALQVNVMICIVQTQSESVATSFKEIVTIMQLLSYACRVSFIMHTVQQERLVGKSLAKIFFQSIWQKNVWPINRSAKRLLIVNTNLDGFSLANHEQFTKFAKLFSHQTFPLYGSLTFPLILLPMFYQSTTLYTVAAMYIQNYL